MTEEELERVLQEEYDRVIADTYKRLLKDKPITRAKLHAALLKANKIYWITRLKKIDEFFYLNTEQTARILTVPYMNAAREFSQQLKNIYANYQSAFHLAQKDADRLLKTVKYDRSIADNLKAIANEMPSGAEKGRILAEISAPAYRFRMQRADMMAQQVAETCRSIASGEIRTERVISQSRTEQSYSITLEGLSEKLPSQTIVEEITKQAAPVQQAIAPTAAKGIQEFTPTTEHGIFASFNQINERVVKQITNRNWSGKSFSSRIWDNTDDLAKEVKKILLEGELKGAGVDKMSAELQRRFEVGAYQARRLIRTECNYVQNQATLQAFRETDVERYEYAAFLDERTSDICEDLNGEIFYVKDAKVGVNYPPMHPNCRSGVLPVVKTLEEIRQETDAIIDSWNMPDNMSFEDYVNQRTEEALKRMNAT